MAPTLPRRLHRAILRLLRPLESATRRLIIIAARDLPVPALPASAALPPLLPAKPASRTCIRIVKINLGLAGCVPAPPPPPPVRRSWSLPMADPLKRFGPRRRYVPPHAAPRILSFDGAVPHKLPPPPGPHDPIDATRLSLRLAGISRALSDLPAQARRYVRCKARSDARRLGRGLIPRSPLRPGRAPGWRTRSKEEINEVLADLQYFAREVLRPPDTS